MFFAFGAVSSVVEHRFYTPVAAGSNPAPPTRFTLGEGAMNKTPSFVLPVLAALLSLAGIAGFIVLFARDMTIFWFILSPLILIVYQFPAFVVFRMWKRKRAQLTREDQSGHRALASEIEEVQEQGDDGGADTANDPGNEG